MYERYCKIRDSLGLRDSDVARKTGITPSTFSDWKKGKSLPNTQKMVAIARALNTTVEYIVDGIEPYQGRRHSRAIRPQPRYLTPEEENLLALWDQLTDTEKEAANVLMNGFIIQKRDTKTSSSSEREGIA